MSKTEISAENWQRIYKLASLTLMIIFGIVGLIFLLIPDQVLTFFNRLSAPLGFMEAPLTGFGFYLILAVGYMYLVTILAYMMFKNPGNTDFPLLLIHGKSASSLLSFALFIVHGQFLIYVTNGIVDGLIALGVFLLFRKVRSAIA